MTMQLDEENNGRPLVIHVSGEPVKADYAQFVPEVERLVRQPGKSRMLFDMTNFRGWDAGAASEDLKFGVEHFAGIERLAMPGDEAWRRGMAMFGKPFTKVQVRYFDDAQTAEARKWLEQA